MVSENGGNHSYVHKAEELARRAHEDQFDKLGEPYIGHVSRVAAAVHGDPIAEAVAWLHDVLEDCPEAHEEFWSFPAEITRRVSWLTRIGGQSSEFYYGRISHDPIARKVKLADIADNADEARLSRLDPATAGRLRAKYAKARAALA